MEQDIQMSELEQTNLINAFDSESDDAETAAVWESHANNIITGIEANDDVKPVRAIWEMVQNARDERKPGTLAEIVFIRQLNNFVFQHDGAPFTKNGINSLIIQTSSKNQNDPEKVGKYGTGFLTTHKFGRTFHLKGSLLPKTGTSYYHNFDDFVLNRESDDKKILGNKIQTKIQEVRGWNQKLSEISTESYRHTIFTYDHRDDLQRDNVKSAMEEAPKLVSYVIALNKGLGSIELVDEVENKRIKYSRIGDYQDVETCQDYILKTCKIGVKKNGADEPDVIIYMLESKEKTEDGDPKVTVILPIDKIDDKYHVQLLDNSIPRLFLSLPLLGTDNWAYNYIVHAPKFSCDKEDRDKVRFSGNSEETQKKAEANRSLLELASKLIIQFIDHNLVNIVDRKYLAPVRFRMLNANEKTKEYFKTQQSWWVEKFENRQLVENEQPLLTSTIKVFDEELLTACTLDSALLDSIYHIFDKCATAPQHPSKDDMLYWSRTINDWYEDKSKAHFLSASHIADLIATTTFVEEDLDQLYVFEKYLSDNNKTKLFEEKDILPNIDLVLCKSSGTNIMLDAVSFNSTVMSVLRTLCPNVVSHIAHSKFAKLLRLTAYTNESMKTSVTDRIKELVALQKYSYLKIDKQNGRFLLDNYNKTFFGDEDVKAILKIYTMILEPESIAVESKAYPLLKEFYSFNEVITDTIEKDLFDNRTCFNALLRDALFKFTCMTKDEKELKRDWISRFLIATQDNSDTRTKFLVDYEVCADQLGDFHYADKLSRECDNVPAELKVIYDKVIKKVTDENKSQSILHALIDSRFNAMVAETSITGGSTLAGDLEKIVKDEYHYDLKDKDYTDDFVNIIKHLSGRDDEAKKWQDLFKDIDSHKGQLLLSAIESDKKKDHIFNFINADEDKLEKLAKVMDNPKLDRLLRLGEEQLKIEERNDNDFQFKLNLGKYVENYLRVQLQSILGNSKINIPTPIKDQQGGQDLIIYLENTPVYYIEVKSRWGTDRSVRMSTTQHQRSMELRDQYSLCVVDMSGYKDKFGNDCVDLHIYPDDPNEITDRIKVIEDIGTKNLEIKDACTQKEDKVYVASGYQVFITQDLIKNEGVPFETFKNDLINKISNIIETGEIS